MRKCRQRVPAWGPAVASWRAAAGRTWLCVPHPATVKPRCPYHPMCPRVGHTLKPPAFPSSAPEPDLGLPWDQQDLDVRGRCRPPSAQGISTLGSQVPDEKPPLPPSTQADGGKRCCGVNSKCLTAAGRPVAGGLAGRDGKSGHR